MSIQMIDAPKGKVFVPTYLGRKLKERFEKEPKLKYRVPKHWIGQGFVELVDEKEVM